MFYRVIKCPFFALFVCATVLATSVLAQRPTPTQNPQSRGAVPSPLEGGDPTVNINVYVLGADGGPIEVTAVVTLIAATGQVLSQGTTLAGNIQFNGVAANNCTIQVVAPGYETSVKEFDSYSAEAARINIQMQPASNGGTGAGSTRILLAPKVQKELGKALEALRANKPNAAKDHLDAAYRKAPNHPAVNYLFGVYFLQMKDQEKAKSYWTKALEFDPKYASALLALSETLAQEGKLSDAESFGKRAVEADPSGWRGHAILANVLLRENSLDAAIKEAERALELGHGQAASVQPLLARALAENGNKARAINVLQTYVQEHPSDAAARKQLDDWRSPPVIMASPVKVVAAEAKTSTGEATIALPLPSAWLPPDVDDKVPPVEPGAVCAIDQVVQKAGKRVQEFVKNVDRYTANELLTHQSIDKWGIASSSETRKFEYLASIEQYKTGHFSVTEYRTGVHSLSEFPDGIATNGLPALALIFHPSNAGDFEMSCEGLSRMSGGLAWQVHFRQRPDKPNTMREYRIGEGGPSYPVALRGRAWIAADSYQIVRMETDLVATVPQIRLLTDHTIVEYGPVHFRKRNVEMWLPQSAELYCDWKGKRMHRRLSFSHYMLFSVDEKQNIAPPKEQSGNQTKVDSGPQS